MCANWSRCSARASAFAPASSSTEGPSRAGSDTAIAGRSTPGRRRRWSRPAASTAPVFPAETTASASPSATARTAETRRRVGLGAHRVGRLLGHLDHLERRAERQAARVEPGRARRSARRCRRRPPRRRRPRPRRAPCRLRVRRPRSAATRPTEPGCGAARSRAPCTCRRSGRRGAAASASRTAGTR